LVKSDRIGGLLNRPETAKQFELLG
jgi:hypothetical protein